MKVIKLAFLTILTWGVGAALNANEFGGMIAGVGNVLDEDDDCIFNCTLGVEGLLIGETLPLLALPFNVGAGSK